MTWLFIIIIIVIIIGVIVSAIGREARKVKQELIEEVKRDKNKIAYEKREEIERITDMSEEEIIKNYPNRFR